MPFGFRVWISYPISIQIYLTRSWLPIQDLLLGLVDRNLNRLNRGDMPSKVVSISMPAALVPCILVRMIWNERTEGMVEADGKSGFLCDRWSEVSKDDCDD